MHVLIQFVEQAYHDPLDDSFVDRDMMARFLGLGIGHLKVKAVVHETMPIIYDHCGTNKHGAQGASDNMDINEETPAYNIEGADNTQIGGTDEQTMEDAGEDGEEDEDYLEIRNVDELYADL